MGTVSKKRKNQKLRGDELVLNIWQRLTRILVFLSIIGISIIVFSLFGPEWDKLQAMDEENANLQKRLDELKLVRVERLQDELHTSNDMEYLEIVARDKLNMKMPGEVIFRIQR
ncbi:MAG: septum formation initiator family protein [Verrucomicrobiales bacterium]|nr:MAG: septum formation initiator family protein [Verrucomicrobiota bacterium]|tara:strand:+ start:578 stop:919 length:342 start_codon:yes stop_codon:yes gene_type:complete